MVHDHTLKVNYALAKSAMKWKQFYRFDRTTDRDPVIYDESIGNLVLRACLYSPIYNILFF